MKNFKDVSNSDWECYEKEYDEFTLVVDRSKRGEELFFAHVNLGGSASACIARNVTLDWISKLEQLLDDTVQS